MKVGKMIKELSDFEGQMRVKKSGGLTEVICTRVLVEDLEVIDDIQHCTGLFRQSLIAKAVNEFAQKYKPVLAGNKVTKKRKGG